MSALDTVLAALGRGDSATGQSLAILALCSAGPAMLVIAILLAMGPGK